MAKNDTGLIQLSDIAQAVMLLSRLPVPAAYTDRGGRAAWAYPLAGLLVGSIAAGGMALSHAMGIPAPLSALLAIVVLTITTGAMHEDGLADTADGLWGGWTPEKRLEIMKDSHIGTYGVLALLAGLSARWVTLWFIVDQSIGTACAAIIAAAMLSRATMTALMAALPHARETGLSHSVGAAAPGTAALAWALGGGAVLLLLGLPGFWAILCALLATGLVGWIAHRKIGGQTGDILGACQQVSEIAILASALT